MENESNVKWNDDMKALFERLMENTPEMFRDIAIKTTGEKAEANAHSRGVGFVEIEDIARACLSEAPEVFRPQVINDLKREGIDAEKYM
jgi:hypothetical protein